MLMEAASTRSDGVDFIWLAQRCCALHAESLQIPPQVLNTLQRKADQCLESGDTNGLVKAMEQLLDHLGLGDVEWRSQPTSDALPMIALIPNAGCCLVYGKTDQGAWLLEGPQGSHRIVHFPAEARFTAVNPPSDATKGIAPASASARATSMQPRSAPPVTRLGST